ncbi:Low-density lipoprotein receptor-related protein 6 [Stylophora pistillata]|uniref:Low-density lipoprotein receptor-related protein 6 n=1 Tax=Stylophora pistillata TaxID=50429 RepID=A0A2B4RLC6_STYPI|nr:Low-density lipoprotein receptor-related protein 6 [Stylophora pistillata]
MKITWWIFTLSTLWIYKQRTNLCEATLCSTSCLIVSNATDIFTLDFETSTINPVISGLTRAVAIDLYFDLGLVFWSDVAELSIKRLDINTDNKTTIITKIGVCNGLAVEWRSSQLFWTDKTNNTISVSDLDAIISQIKARKALCNFMFWTDWGVNPKIERANLSGSQRTAIVTTNLYHPNGIDLDKGNRRIFWVDEGLDRVESIDYNGGNRT